MNKYTSSLLFRPESSKLLKQMPAIILYNYVNHYTVQLCQSIQIPKNYFTNIHLKIFLVSFPQLLCGHRASSFLTNVLHPNDMSQPAATSLTYLHLYVQTRSAVKQACFTDSQKTATESHSSQCFVKLQQFLLLYYNLIN
jgi:hypothetical protein